MDAPALEVTASARALRAARGRMLTRMAALDARLLKEKNEKKGEYVVDREVVALGAVAHRLAVRDRQEVALARLIGAHRRVDDLFFLLTCFFLLPARVFAMRGRMRRAPLGELSA